MFQASFWWFRSHRSETILVIDRLTSEERPSCASPGDPGVTGGNIEAVDQQHVPPTWFDNPCIAHTIPWKNGQKWWNMEVSGRVSMFLLMVLCWGSMFLPTYKATYKHTHPETPFFFFFCIYQRWYSICNWVCNSFAKWGAPPSA